eukprot:COSAG02_NODE_2594_length_8461_cov_189.802320_1_plen_81_part_10
MSIHILVHVRVSPRCAQVRQARISSDDQFGMCDSLQADDLCNFDFSILGSYCTRSSEPTGFIACAPTENSGLTYPERLEEL